ncbi:MAG: hypothetical protein IIZ48_05955 [Erysipelotrichales bacterium]|nr:hypothetical protein [Erysipelotrichales bacterium]
MKNSHRKYWMITGLIIAVSSLIMFLGRSSGFVPEDFSGKKAYISTQGNRADYITGILNNTSVYNDKCIDNAEDLYSHSEIILSVKIESKEQLEHAEYIDACVEDVVKGESLRLGDAVRFIVPNYYSPNSYGKNTYSVDFNKPLNYCINTPSIVHSGENYLVFLNEIEGYKSIYRLSSLYFGVIPLKEHVKIYERKNSDYSENVHYPYLCPDEYDYVVDAENPSDSMTGFETEDEKHAHKKADDIVNYYSKIVEDVRKKEGMNKPIIDLFH